MRGRATGRGAGRRARDKGRMEEGWGRMKGKEGGRMKERETKEDGTLC